VCHHDLDVAQKCMIPSPMHVHTLQKEWVLGTQRKGVISVMPDTRSNPLDPLLGVRVWSG
jgi:hypothetical protein